MGVAELRLVLNEVADVSSCCGTAKLTERLAVMLPDGDVGATDDPKFVEWLLANAEPAPYGDGTKTKVDKKVRSAQRLVARGEIEVSGFDPTAVLPEIEAVLSPTVKLAAHLTDVIIYKKGDKFTRHKDTPRQADLVGTLIVGLPIEHTGGVFIVDDGRGAKKHDWSGKPKKGMVPWVALFSDVEHEIRPVTSGARVTFVYSLRRTDQPRTDAGATERQAIMKRAASALARQAEWPVMIPCSRQVITEPEAKQPQSIDCLRGADRAIAEGLLAAGYQVAVRACVAAIPNYENPPSWPETGTMWEITRLSSVPPIETIVADNPEIEDYILDEVPLEQCAIRETAAATLVMEDGEWAMKGMFGNEGYQALVYTLASLEVTVRNSKPAKPNKASRKQKARKR